MLMRLRSLSLRFTGFLLAPPTRLPRLRGLKSSGKNLASAKPTRRILRPAFTQRGGSHQTDQLGLLSDLKLLPALRARPDVEANLESRERLQR
jgi:hypothetical protein